MRKTHVNINFYKTLYFIELFMAEDIIRKLTKQNPKYLVSFLYLVFVEVGEIITSVHFLIERYIRT